MAEEVKVRMKQDDLNTWDELENKVSELYEFLKSNSSSIGGNCSRPLFRGQRCSSWHLSTTLERYVNRSVSVESYNEYLGRIKSAVESYTANKWKVDPTNPELGLREVFQDPPNYEFMAYVRHHGFPSPLLDWSQSIYIALFFAFHKANIKGRVAIYAYVEVLGSGKHGYGGAPQICELGPYVSTHKRHFMQQGQYTISVEKPDKDWVYCSHEKVFNAKADDQDYLIKFTLPGGIKNQVLKKLQSMNINSFTLYGSEDSLMDMLAFKEILPS